MKTEKLKEILTWIRSTDLVEVSFREGATNFSLATTDAPPAEVAPLVFPARFTPVCADAVGVFQWNAPGKARTAEEGKPIAQDGVLGLIETAPGKTTPVKAPCAGSVSRVMVESGDAVQYGQPLFFLEPTAA